MSLKSIIYPILSAVIAMIIATIVVVLTRIGFAEALNLQWGWGVAAIIVAGIVLIGVSGLLSLPTLYLARRVEDMSQRVTLNLPVLIYFIGAIFSYVSIFTVNKPYGFAHWVEAILAMIAILVFSLRVSFLPIIVISSNRQK
ncbi:MAG: hypothetical protein K2I94_09030 [Muribaculaceae bacterium]|nr:hypothetical protein [Muribaculaceae bacterium]